MLLFDRMQGYTQKLYNIAPANLVAYWPFNEASGSWAYDKARPGEWLVNGGFETAGAGGADVWGTWVETASDGALANETTIVFAGSDAAKITAGASTDTKVAQTVTVQASKSFTLKFYTRGDGTNGGRYLIYDVSNAADIVATTATGVTGTTYTQITKTFTTPVGCTSIRIDLICPATDTGIAYFDAVELVSQKDGAYTGVTLGQSGIGDGFTCPLFDGTSDFVNIYSAGLLNGWSGQEITIAAWIWTTSGIMAGGTTPIMFRLGTDGSNDVFIRKSAANTLLWRYIAGGTTLGVTNAWTTDQSWFHVALTASLSGDAMKAYLNGAQVGTTQTGLGTHSNGLVATTCAIGAASTVPASVLDGKMAHPAIWNTPLSAAQIAALTKI